MVNGHQVKPGSESNLYVEWVECKREASKDANQNSDPKAGAKAFYPGSHGQAGGVQSLTFVERKVHLRISLAH